MTVGVRGCCATALDHRRDVADHRLAAAGHESDRPADDRAAAGANDADARHSRGCPGAVPPVDGGDDAAQGPTAARAPPPCRGRVARIQPGIRFRQARPADHQPRRRHTEDVSSLVFRPAIRQTELIPACDIAPPANRIISVPSYRRGSPRADSTRTCRMNRSRRLLPAGLLLLSLAWLPGCADPITTYEVPYTSQRLIGAFIFAPDGLWAFKLMGKDD